MQLLSVMVQACCLALLDACVPMTSVFAGVTCAYTSDDEFILDPNLEQEEVSKCCHGVFDTSVKHFCFSGLQVSADLCYRRENWRHTNFVCRGGLYT